MSRMVTSISWVAPATLAISVHVAVAFVPLDVGGSEKDAPPPVELSIRPPQPAPPAEPAAEPPSEPPVEPPSEPPPESAPPAQVTEAVSEPETSTEEPKELGLDSAVIAESERPSALPPADKTFASVSPPPAPPSAEVDLSGYRDGLYRALNAARRYPTRARRLGLEGKAEVKITLRRDGSLEGRPVLVSSTGHEILDEEVLRLAAEKAPFAPLPEGYPDRDAEFLIPVVFEHRN